MTDCWRCASVINICFTFHSALNINFKHKSKQVTRSCLPSILVSDGVLTADSSDSDTEQLLSIPVTSSVRWGLAALLVLVLGPGMESEILAAPAWRRGLQRGGHPPDQLEQVHSACLQSHHAPVPAGKWSGNVCRAFLQQLGKNQPYLFNIPCNESVSNYRNWKWIMVVLCSQMS